VGKILAKVALGPLTFAGIRAKCGG